MSTFNYEIQTSGIQASGSIEAESQEAAEKLLHEQYLPKDHGFVNGKGKPVEHKLVDLTLTEV